MIMTQFRRSVISDTKKKAGKGGGRKAWFEKFKLPQNSPTPFILINEEYVDLIPTTDLVETDPVTGQPKPVKNLYYKGRKHRRAMKRNGRDFFAEEICSAGSNPHDPQPCCGCFAMDTGDKTVTLVDFYNIGIVHLAFYHGHPVIQDGKPLSRKDGSGLILNYDECTGRTCNYCRVMAGQQPVQGTEWPGYDPRSLTTIFGQRRFLEIGKGHLSDLMGWDQIISSQCGVCRSQLSTDGFDCGCGFRVIDMATDARSDEEIGEIVSHSAVCPSCHRTTLLQERVSCEVCESRGTKGAQFGVFDVVLFGMRQGEGTQSHLVQGRSHQSVEEFAQTVDANFLGGKTMRQYIAELAKPYDFTDIKKARTLDEQSKNLDLPKPQNAASQQPQYMQYQQPSTTPPPPPQFQQYATQQASVQPMLPFAPTKPNFGK